MVGTEAPLAAASDEEWPLAAASDEDDDDATPRSQKRGGLVALVPFDRFASESDAEDKSQVSATVTPLPNATRSRLPSPRKAVDELLLFGRS